MTCPEYGILILLQCPEEMLLSGYLDQNVSASELYAIAQHLMSCPSCLET